MVVVVTATAVSLGSPTSAVARASIAAGGRGFVTTAAVSSYTSPDFKVAEPLTGISYTYCDGQMAAYLSYLRSAAITIACGFLVKSENNEHFGSTMSSTQWSAFTSSKEYRGYLRMPPVTVQCSGGTVSSFSVAPGFQRSLGYTKTLTSSYEAGDPYVEGGDYYNRASPRVHLAADRKSVEMSYRIASRLADPERGRMHAALGRDAPFIWLVFEEHVGCSGAAVDLDQSTLPSIHVYANGKQVLSQAGQDLGAFTAAGDKKLDLNGAGPLDPYCKTPFSTTFGSIASMSAPTCSAITSNAPTSLETSPPLAIVKAGGSLRFVARDQVGDSVGTLAATSWSLNGEDQGDSLTSDGTYTAGSVPYRVVFVDAQFAANGPAAESVALVADSNGNAEFAAPENLAATLNADGTSATLSWTPPSSPGVTLAGYTITTTPATTTTSAPASAVGATITGLIPGSDYSVTVVATSNNPKLKSQPATADIVASGGPLTGVISVNGGFAGAYCAIAMGGAVKCWGDNTYGELGDGTNVNSAVAVQVRRLTSGVTSISTDDGFSYCAIVTGGGVKCWGAGDEGDLGNGSGRSSDVPVQVSGLTSGVTSITSGGDGNYCAIAAGGAAKCWGWNADGELGDGTSADNSDVPVQVSGLTSGVSSITSGGGGFGHTYCAVVKGSAKCWGSGAVGQLGNGTTGMSRVPVQVSGLTSGVSAISSGMGSFCAVVAGGAAKCWGYNVDGELGDGITNAVSAVPVQVSGLTSGVTSITGNRALFASAGGYCAVVAGGANCWGVNDGGQLGNGTNIDSSVPVQVNGLTSGVTGITYGAGSYCAVVAGGAECWGWNGFGNLGNETLDASNVPVQVTDLTTGVAPVMATNEYGYCAVVNAGAECWGSNDAGLGDGVSDLSLIPVQVIT